MVDIEDMEEEIFTCVNCGYETSNIDDLVCINGDLYCDDCYYTCSDCGEYCLEVDELPNGDEICRSCRWDHYHRCENCFDLIHVDESFRYHGDVLCESCYNDVHGDIREYHDTPTWYMRSVDDSEDLRSPRDYMKLIGIEFEMQNGDRSSFVSRINDVFDGEKIAYCMHDGSLDDETGVECITMPMTYEFFRQKFPLQSMCNIARSEGMESHNTNQCGLHIHASKAYFGNTTKEQQTTLLKLVYILDFYRYDFILKASRRKQEEFDSWAQGINLNIRTDYSEFQNKSGHRSIINERYTTYELRAFNGTLKETSVIASVDLYIGLINFCRSHSWELIDRMTLNDLMSYLGEDSANLKEYFVYRRFSNYTHNDLIITKMSLLQVDIEREAEIRSHLWNNTYSSINPVIETYYSGYYGRMRENFIIDHTVMLNGLEPENIHFMINTGIVNDAQEYGLW